MKTFYFIIINILIFVNNYATSSTTEVLIPAENYVVDSYQNWMNEIHGCENLKTYKSKYTNRELVEKILICRALFLSGENLKIKFLPVPNYERAKLMVTNGEVDMHGETIWDSEIDKKYFYVTDPVIKSGEFEKGVYVRADNQKKFHIKTKEDLKKLVAIMPSIWKVDFETLTKMGVNIISPATKEKIYNMIETGRGDFTLVEFSNNNDLSSIYNNVKLLPVLNVKVGLIGSRSYIVSKKSPIGNKLYNSLMKGLTVMKKKGEIARAWHESGFFNEKVRTWKKLN